MGVSIYFCARSNSISGPTQVDCSVPAVYTATPVDGGASPVYQWKVNGNNVGTNSSTFSTVSLQAGDVVSCDLSSSIACAYPVIANSNTIEILILDPPPGNPSVFGDNEWRVYAWNAGGAEPNPDSWNTNYSGYYTATGLNFNTQNQWNADFSPSTASGYQGCFVGNDNHSFSAKRKGFTCAYYRISIDGHDDAAQLWIDGAMVWEHIGCDDVSAAFTIEESLTITGATTICQGSSATLQANIAGPVIWNSGSYTFAKTSSGQADAIVASTHITRGNNGFIYNAVTQSGPNASGVCNASVQNVQWALGPIDDWASLTYTNTMPVPGCAGYNIPGLQLVMRLVAENIYLQVTFSYWQDGGGGRFTYTRTTGPSFLWSTGETTPSISVSAAGTYTVTVNTGENGCTNAAGHTVTISQPTFTATH